MNRAIDAVPSEGGAVEQAEQGAEPVPVRLGHAWTRLGGDVGVADPALPSHLEEHGPQERRTLRIGLAHDDLGNRSGGTVGEGVAVVGEAHLRLRDRQREPGGGEAGVQGVEPLGLECGGVLAVRAAPVHQHQLPHRPPPAASVVIDEKVTAFSAGRPLVRLTPMNTAARCTTPDSRTSCGPLPPSGSWPHRGRDQQAEGRQTPCSVTIAVISSAGVTSKAGL